MAFSPIQGGFFRKNPSALSKKTYKKIKKLREHFFSRFLNKIIPALIFVRNSDRLYLLDKLCDRNDDTLQSFDQQEHNLEREPEVFHNSGTDYDAGKLLHCTVHILRFQEELFLPDLDDLGRVLLATIFDRNYYILFPNHRQ